MQPNYNYTPSANQLSPARIFHKFWAVGGLIVLIIIAFFVWQSLQFHIVSTTPNMGQVAAITPYITFNFNQPLDAKSVKINSSINSLPTPKVNGKVLTINLAQTLVVGNKYSITLVNVVSTSGHTIKNKVFTFTAKDIPFSKLPKDQQQAILKKQAQRPYTKETITYIGINALLDSGTSANQIDSLKQAFYNYSKKVNKEFKQVVIDTSSIRFKPFDPTHPSLTTVYFSVTIEGSPYQATLDETGLSTVRLYLYNPGGNSAVYDSGAVDTSGLDPGTM